MMIKLPLPRSVAPAGAASRLRQRELGLDLSASYENNRGSLDLIYRLRQGELGLDLSVLYENNRGSLDLIYWLCKKECAI